MSNENNNLPAVGASQGVVDKMKDQSLGFFNPTAWEGINLMAKTFHGSGALPRSLDSAPKVIMALQAGKEAGMQPLEALSAFAPINGKMTMYGDAVIAQVAKAGHSITWGKCDKTTATVTIKRCDNKKEMTETWTIEDAKEANIFKNVWLNHPRRMLKYKAFAEVAHFLVPDALKGVIVREFADEYEPVKTEEKPVAQKEQVAATTETVSTERPSLNDAIDKEPEVVEEMPEEPKRLKADVIKDIEKLAKEKGVAVKTILIKYKKTTIDKFTVPELLTIEQALQQTVVKAIEGEIEGEAWPEEVCIFLRFVEEVGVENFDEDIKALKEDANSGVFKGYEAYPNLKAAIKTMPKDFK